MIDFAKIQVPTKYGPGLLQHPALSFERNVNEDNGTINATEPRAAIYEGMKFEIYPSGRIYLLGSWHKLHSNGRNCEDFTFTDFVQTVDDFCATFKLIPEDLHLLQLEFGVNIHPPLKTKETIRQFVSNSKGDSFGAMRSSRGRSLGIVCELTEYSVKIYDKGRQYHLPDQLLRIEQKVTCGKYIRRMGIHKILDLQQPEVWQRLSIELLKTLQNLIIREPFLQEEKLSTSQKLFLHKAGNAHYWDGITPNERQKAKIRLNDIVQRYGTINLKENLHARCIHKIDSLLPHIKKGYVFPEVINSKKSKRIDFTTSINYGKHTPSANLQDIDHPRRCVTCGRDISGQKKGSKFCSEKLYGHAAKKCRNVDSNPRNNFVRALTRIELQPLLFDHRPFLKLSKNIKHAT